MVANRLWKIKNSGRMHKLSEYKLIYLFIFRFVNTIYVFSLNLCLCVCKNIWEPQRFPLPHENHTNRSVQSCFSFGEFVVLRRRVLRVLLRSTFDSKRNAENYFQTRARSRATRERVPTLPNGFHKHAGPVPIHKKHKKFASARHAGWIVRLVACKRILSGSVHLSAG